MKPYYEHAGITIYHGDCREILDSLAFDVMVTDPPYGISYRNPGAWRSGKRGDTIIGDNGPFDAAHLFACLDGRPACIFGANNFSCPPTPGWIVWDKRLDSPPQRQGDAELAWTNFLGSVRVIRCMWNGGGTFRGENGSPQGLHPTQKPLLVMRQCIEMAGDGAVIDPYAGSGTTLRAAKDLGRRAIGIEIEERYCEIAAKRLSQEVLFAQRMCNRPRVAGNTTEAMATIGRMRNDNGDRE